MAEDGFIDLDELVLLCRNRESKKYISEAISCYRAGAYRSCIVATWIAVVYDFLDKLRELELAGDPKAKQYLTEFENYRVNEDLNHLLDFERRVVALARDEFQLISPVESTDLERLLHDRNRCAHPSMSSHEEMYLPAAELARSHLRSAVTYLLQHAPVQGKAALDRIMTDVQSQYFPVSADEAGTHFRHGPLNRPRESLVRNLVVVLLKTLFREALSEKQFPQHAAALEGTRRLHRAWVESALKANLSKLLRESGDQAIPRATALFSYVPDIWQYVEEDLQGKLKKFVAQLSGDQLTAYLPFALTFDPLKAEARARLVQATPDELRSLISRAPQPVYADRAVEIYAASGSFNAANYWGTQLIMPLALYLAPSHIERIMVAAAENGEIKGSFELGNVLRAIRDAHRVSTERFDDLLKQHGHGKNYPWLLSTTESPPIEQFEPARPQESNPPQELGSSQTDSPPQTN
jgi:hypothetical protein